MLIGGKPDSQPARAHRESEEEKDRDAVTLITMHSCKGLEEGLLSHSRSAAEGSLDEERRLFYVAITRAMRTLKISHCTGQRRCGQLQLLPAHPSRYLKELPAELLEAAEDQAAGPVTEETGKDWFAAMRAKLG